ncbi:MAG: transferase [Candidatus Aminicenantes bacterium]|nr:transferase [Candidatus Aminicenantes bacterium]
MFLITSADQKYWKTKEKALFLGKWCKLFSQKDIWENMTYDVLPYHWDDRHKLYRDYLYLDKLYENTLLFLSERLNQIHGVNHTTRYWRIIIGPWLFYFIQIFFDRYASIIKAEKYNVKSTIINQSKRENWIPKDYREFIRWIEKDEYNHYLYSRIIECINRIPFETKKMKTINYLKSKNFNTKAKFSHSLKKNIGFLLKLYERFIPNKFNKIFLISSHLSYLDQIKLYISLKQFPCFSSAKVITPKSNIKWDLREKLSFKSFNNEFEELLSKIIIDQMPSVYIEGYRKMNKASLDSYPSHPKVIINGNAFNSNDSFKFWAAFYADCGAKFAGVQYGGHYGSGLWSSMEKHEIRIYDRYYTWGWESKEFKNTKPLSAAKLNLIIKKARPEKDGKILLLLTSFPRYSYYMYSIPVASSGTLAYFNDQFRFIKALSKKNQNLLLVRLYQHDYKWSQKKRWLYEFPHIECDIGKKSMLCQLKKSRLLICTYNATAFLETFAANYPTLLFWNPNHWELRPSAKPYFNELRNVGILHDSPESAAKKANEISEDPNSWWNQHKIQSAKNNFCNQFVHTSCNWLNEWIKEIKSLESLNIT